MILSLQEKAFVEYTWYTGRLHSLLEGYMRYCIDDLRATGSVFKMRKFVFLEKLFVEYTDYTGWLWERVEGYMEGYIVLVIMVKKYTCVSGRESVW